MSRILIFVYGALSYVVFLAAFLYAIGFIGGFVVPKSIDSPAEGPPYLAFAVDLGLLGLFAVQHSVMARPVFKRWLVRFVPKAAERSTYVLASSLALMLLFWQWRPLGGYVWDVANPELRMGILGIYGFGWLLVLVTTFVINHFDLFGLRQVWRHLIGQPEGKTPFVTPVLYRMVRHPLYVGWFIVFWAAPTMSITHLFFACATTMYILIAIQFEENDLMREHPEYAEYRRQVPMILPGMPKKVMTARRLSRAGRGEEAA